MSRLVLFDVDGTLLRCGPQVRPLFLGAVAEVFGVVPAADGYDFAGQTDPRIVLDVLARSGLAEDAILSRLPEVRRVYAERLERDLDRARMKLLPGVVALLDLLALRTDVAFGLLTGNWRDGARVKLGRFELWERFPFGAFGDDAVARRDLVPVALARAAELHGRPFAAADTFVVGDSVRDVDCALAAGATPIGVATGFTPAERLREAGAELVFADLVEAMAGVEAFGAHPV